MDVFITADFSKAAQIETTLCDFSKVKYRSKFSKLDFGPDFVGINIVLMCRDPRFNKFHKRLRFSKKDKTLNLDVMLDFEKMIHSGALERTKIIVEQLSKEIPEAINKYRFEDFDKVRFYKDWQEFLVSVLNVIEIDGAG